jgi:hypothetical protein
LIPPAALTFAGVHCRSLPFVAYELRFS